ncbi:OmpA family protein [Myxococcota bacterium]|nr:OmpA family protein [Myxococcota bacterium]
MGSSGLGLAQELPPVGPTNMNADPVRPSIDSTRTLITDDSTAPESKAVYLRATTWWVHNPYLWQWDDGEEVSVLQDAVALGVAAGYGLGPVRVGVNVPFYAWSAGTLQPNGGPTMGDPSLDLKWSLLSREEGQPGVAVVGRGALPIGDPESLLSWGAATWELGLVADYMVGDALLIANVGTRGLPAVTLNELEMNDQLWYRLAAAYAVNDTSGVSLEIVGGANYKTLGESSVGNPSEALLGFWTQVNENVRLNGAMGAGLTEAIGSPAWRLTGGVSYMSSGRGDRDLDGIADRVDACPDDPEDLDKFEDADGCPELDNDKDGLVDTVDACPIDPEDNDGFKDEDGCPEANARVAVEVLSSDGKPLRLLKVALVPASGPTTEQSVNAFNVDLEPGSYLLQASAEGYRASSRTIEVPAEGLLQVREILEPEVKLGTLVLRVQDPSGAPITATWTVDNQGYEYGASGGFAKRDLPEGEHNIIVRAEGFQPGETIVAVTAGQQVDAIVILTPSRVVVTAERIDIREQIFFEYDKAIIKPESYGLLDEVAAIIISHPEILRIRIEGHTDDKGSDVYNLKLSQARADSVRDYLIKRGVPAARLYSIGYGESRPIADNKTPSGQALNRRVVFYIEERAD